MKTSKAFQIVLFSFIALGIQSGGHAQTNLVNLCDWTKETMYSADPNYGIIISSFNSAMFFGAYSTNMSGGPDHIVPIITGNLDTTPGTIYEISYTLAHDGDFVYCDGTMSFGNFTSEIELPAGSGPGSPPHSPASESFDFLVAATSPSTTMSFVWSAIDNGDQAVLSNFSVTAVPEMPASSLFGFGGGVMLALQWLRLFQKRKRN